MNNRYTITEAANILGVHAHTLRYWEEELQLEIPRNEMGHRMYQSEQIEIFETIKKLKEEGYQLNAIRMQVAAMSHTNLTDIVRKESESSASRGDKMQQFQALMSEVVRNAILENKEEISREVSSYVIKEMNYLARELDQEQEKRYRKLDEAIKSTLLKKKTRKSVWGQKEVAEKLKEELKSNKKRAVTQCGNTTT